MSQLSDTNSILLDVVENASEAIVIYDKDGILLHCNENFRRLYGYSSEQAKPGVYFKDLAQLDLDQGFVPVDFGARGLDAYIAYRDELREKSPALSELLLSNGRWVGIEEHPTALGGRVCRHYDITEQKNIESELALRNNLFRVAFNSNTISCAITVLETGKYLDVNTAWSKHLGFSREEAIGKTSLELNIWGSAGNREKLVSRLRKNPSVQDLETQVRTRTGEFRNVSMNLEVIFVGGIECLYISSRDITDNKRFKKAIEKSEQRFQVIFESAPIGMALCNSETNGVQIANQKYLEIVGVPPGKIQNLDWKQITHPDDLQKDLIHQNQMNAGEISAYEMEKRYIHSNGSIRWVEMSVNRIHFGNDKSTKQHIVMLMDITEKKETELALEVSRGRFLNFTQGSTDWYWETDKENRFTFISSAVSKSTGRKASEYIGRTMSEIYGEAIEQQSAQVNLKKLLLVNKSFRDVVVCRQHKETGKRLWFRTSGQPYFNTAGEFMGYRGSSSDITGQLELEEKLQQSQKMEAVGQLTGGIAHDFNNLLAVILGNAEMIKESVDDGLQIQQSQLDAVLRATRRGAELTQSMLAFSRKQDLSPTILRLDQRVEKMLDMLQRTLGETVSITTRFDENLWYCEADPGKVENALLNLCINARDAMPDGGTLAIDVRNVQLDDNFGLSQSELKPGKYIALSVADTGCGIAAEELEHVMEPFYTTKDVGKGTGLGLSMVYGFSRQSRGYLTIDSELGLGTTVTLYLPYSDREEKDAVQARQQLLPTGSGTILVVEDDEDVREMTVFQLEALGYNVLEANDGEGAMDALQQRAQSIDILITDAVLPGKMSGMDIAQVAVAKNDAIKIILMTGYGGDALDVRLEPEHQVAHLQKPFRKAELAEKIQNIYFKESSQ